MGEDNVNEMHRGIGRGDCIRHRNQMDHFAEAIDEHQDARASLRIGGSPKITSIDTERQALVATGSGRRGACDDGEGFTRWQSSQERTHLRTHLYMWGQ
ncbi:hypothetical protein PC129_g8193 [Phytophthora cactorum]|uniref:Uncharacterized protein n=1 Tax=Phytophthora cactorum TaxID=29920 RepID=A0A329RAF4_9STRA|nr:hypothetical protein Pcac1_g28601 [Phytophthora cactorum]KAG2818974.1 hypothetical protein PC112_g12385 [Phytophthora cactorum]KAG2822207.1 hypothetical protein PC111_g10708 [Phytophthora cactorum]KAG2857924.1 hypothetical protein PC113_g10260 [Phytophthora cactorum]KAG2913941.1 hypothetical protein PC115_g11830 [Phytophthora cactorum]